MSMPDRGVRAALVSRRRVPPSKAALGHELNDSLAGLEAKGELAKDGCVTPLDAIEAHQVFVKVVGALAQRVATSRNRMCRASQV